METIARVCFIWLGGLAVLGARWAWKYGWANKTGRMPGWWQWGEAGWRAYSRAYPALAFVIFSGAVTAFTHDPVAYYATLGIIVSTVLAWTVALFSWPAIVIPPARRHEPGLVRAWWASWPTTSSGEACTAAPGGCASSPWRRRRTPAARRAERRARALARIGIRRYIDGRRYEPEEADFVNATIEPVACCGPLAAQALSDEEAAATAGVFKALADPARVRIVNVLATTGEPVCVCNLIEPLGLSQPTVSHHLKKLMDAGLLEREQRGRWAYFSLRRDAVEKLAAVVDLEGACC